MRVSVTKLDPKKAQKLLDSRASNRPLDEKYAQRLAGAMRSGKWKLNGETIKINDHGQMEDGQHRCLAVVLSGCTITVAIATNLESSNGVFETIDTGKRRTIGHVFARANEENYAMLASAVAWLWRYEKGSIMIFDSPRHDEATDFLSRHPKLRESCHAVHGVRKLMPCGLAAALHYMFSSKDAELAEWFFNHLGTGEDLRRDSVKTSAIWRLRELLTEERDKRSRRHAYVNAALVIKAWNATRAGKLCKTLRWTASESFPEVE